MTNNLDAYGFTKYFENNSVVDSSNINESNIKKVLLWILIIFFLIMILGMIYISGYIAWNEFTNDPTWLKLSKTYIAVIFAPIYLFYVFCKSIVFNLPR